MLRKAEVVAQEFPANGGETRASRSQVFARALRTCNSHFTSTLWKMVSRHTLNFERETFYRMIKFHILNYSAGKVRLVTENIPERGICQNLCTSQFQNRPSLSPRAIPGHLTRVKLRTVENLTQNEARPVGHLTFVSKRLSAVGNKRISQLSDSACEPHTRSLLLSIPRGYFCCRRFI